MTAEHVVAALADRLPAGAPFLEESSSSRGRLPDLIPAREHFSFLTNAEGGLGFALPAATGIKIVQPERPVVALLGDGASLYCVQALWSARRYGVGTLYVVLSNGGYAVMARLAAIAGGKPPWPGFGEVSLSRIAEGRPERPAQHPAPQPIARGARPGEGRAAREGTSQVRRLRC